MCFLYPQKIYSIAIDMWIAVLPLVFVHSRRSVVLPISSSTQSFTKKIASLNIRVLGNSGLPELKRTKFKHHDFQIPEHRCFIAMIRGKGLIAPRSAFPIRKVEHCTRKKGLASVAHDNACPLLPE
jgi:hypothetical protein